MADYSSLRIIVTADTRNLGKQIGDEAKRAGESAGKTMGQSISGALGRAASGIGSALASVTKVTAGVLGTATIAAAGFGLASIGASLRVDELNLAMAAVAKGTKSSLPQMQAATKGIAGQGVAYADAQKLVIDFTRANLSLTDAQKVATAAQDLAVLSGKSSSETTAILTEAIIKQSPQLLEAAGVTTSLGQAQLAYSKKTGIAVDAMTVADKQQALLNEVLRQGGQVTGTYEASMQNAGKVIRSMPRLFNDLAVSVGQRLTPAITPLVLKSYELAKAFVAAIQEGGPLSPLVDAIGSAFQKLVEPATAALDSLLGWIKQLKPGQFTGIAQAIGKFAPVIAAVATGLATFAAGGILDKIPILGKVLGNLGGPLGAVAAGVAVLVATSPDLRASFGEILTAAKPMLAVLADVGKQVMGTLMVAMKAIAPVITQVGMVLAGGLTAAVLSLAPALPKLADAFLAVVQAVLPLLPPLAELVVALVNSALVPIVLKLADVVSTLATSFPGATAGVLGFALAFGPMKSGIGSTIGMVEKFGGAISKAAGSGLLDKLPALDGFRLKIMGMGDGMAGLSGVLKTAGGAVKAFSMTLLASPITWIVVGVVALGAAFVLAYKHIEPFRKVVDAVAKALLAAGKAILSGVVSAFKSLAGIATTVAKAFVDVGKAVSTGVTNAVKFVGQLPGKAVAALVSFGSKLGKAVSSAWTSVLTAVQTGIGWVVTAFGKITDVLAPVVAVFGKILGIVTFPMQGIVDVIKGAIAIIIGIFTLDLGKILSGVGKIFDGLLQLFFGFPVLAITALIKFGPMVLSWIGGVFAGLGSAIVAGLTAAVAFFATLPGRALAAISSLTSRIVGLAKTALSSMGAAISTGLANAVKFFATLPARALTAISALTSRIVGLARTALSAMGTAITSGITSAVTFFAGLPGRAVTALASLGSKIASTGRTALAALGTAISTGVTAALKFFTDLPGKAVAGLADLAGKLKTVATEALAGMLGGLSSAVTGIFTWFQRLPGAIIATVSGIGHDMASIGRSIVDGIISGIGDVGGMIWNKIKGGLGGLVAKAKGALGISSPSRVFAKEVGAPITAGIEVGVESGQQALNQAISRLVEIPEVIVRSDVAALARTGPGVAMAAANAGTLPGVGTGDVSSLLRQVVRLLEAGTRVDIDSRPIASAMSAATLYGVTA